MFYIITTIILTVVVLGCGIGALVAYKKYKQAEKEHWTIDEEEASVWLVGCGITAVVALVIAGIVTALNLFYTQDPGQASVLVSFTGQVEGINYETGLHTKAPWSNRVEYDIRNNSLSYVGQQGNENNFVGGSVSGPQITFQDANGVSGNIDLNVRYSIRGDAVGDIYNEYKTQQEFVNAALAPAVRSITREIFSKYGTSEVYNEREKIQPELVKAIQSNWDKLGVDVEEIYLQEVRYPQNVVDSFANAQAARAEVETAKAQQEKAKIEAETNKIKSTALTDAVLKEKLIDALKNGKGTYIIDTNNISVGVK